MISDRYQPKPPWLRASMRTGAEQLKTPGVVRKHGLSTVCREARCPNQSECYGRGTAAFMILGSNCTRNCTFCCVGKNHPEPVDPREPDRVADAVAELGLQYVVITSVTRDDLQDGGARHFADTVTAVRSRCPETAIELLIPDLNGDWDALSVICDAAPNVLNHNVETVPDLYPAVRPSASYERSLELLDRARQLGSHLLTKSGLMLGMGESDDQVIEVLADLRHVGCTAIAVGQYLPPSRSHYPVREYVQPDRFNHLGQEARRMGFTHVASGPLVRSSYHADALVSELP